MRLMLNLCKYSVYKEYQSHLWHEFVWNIANNFALRNICECTLISTLAYFVFKNVSTLSKLDYMAEEYRIILFIWNYTPPVIYDTYSINSKTSKNKNKEI